MSEATKCDRCGAYIDKSVSDMPQIAYCYSIQRERKHISLCYECYNNFLNDYVPKDKSDEEKKKIAEQITKELEFMRRNSTYGLSI